MWSDPAGRLADLGRLLRPGGRIALVAQPRCPGATAAADELGSLLDRAGFERQRVETLELDPPVAFVLATRPTEWE